MSSRIATKFLSLPNLDSEVSNLIWRYADLTAADSIYSIPSINYVQELLLLLDGPKATEIVSIIPSPSILDALFNGSTRDEVTKGIIQNRFTSMDTLKRIEKEKDQYSELIKNEFKKYHDDFSVNASFSLRVLEDYNNEGRLSKFFAQVASFGEKKMSELFKSLYSHNPKLASLVVMTSLETGNKLDLLMVEFIYREKSFMNEAIVVKLESEFKNLSKLTNKVTPAAIDFLIANDYLSVKKAVSEGSGTNESTAKMLLATGLEEATIATLMLGSDKNEIDSTFLTQTLAKASDGLISQFVLGTTERKPRPEEIGMLFKALGPSRVKKIVSEHSEVITSLEWSEELILAAPLIEIKNLGLASTLRLYWSVEKKLKNDLQAWELFLVMSEEWEDSVESLMNSANIMSVLA